jgi:predicted AAA+ superfamily ATPase
VKEPACLHWTNWSRLAAEMAVPSARGGTADYRSVRDYVEVLAAAYFLLVVYFWRPDADSNAISKDKKLYLGDPLLHAVARDRAPGLSIDEPALVENAVAMALFRRYEPLDQQFEGFLTPRDLHVWGSARGGEIDFVCGPRQRIEAVEVKYRVRVDRRSAVAVSRAFPGRPAVVVTRDELRFTPTYALIPAGLFLWALG